MLPGDLDYQFTPAQQIINEGAIVRHTRDGIAILMKHTLPGVFFDEHGNEVGPAIAKQAGFDTKALGLERKKREAIAKVTAEMEAEYARTATVWAVCAEKNGYKLVSIGLGRFNIYGPGDDKNPLNTKGPFTDKKLAERTFEGLTATIEDDVEDEQKAA